MALLRLPPLALLFALGLLWGVLRFLFLLPFRRRVPSHAELKLEGPLLWQQPPHPGVGGRWRREPPSIEGIRNTLRQLAKEEALRGVVVSPHGLRASHARMQALAEELRRFRESGKEVVLYLREATARELVLAPAANQVLLAPGGTVMLLGEAAVLTGLRGLLDRLGVLPEFLRIGDYKTAPELFTREAPSEIQRDFTERVLDARYERLLDIVGARRNGDREWARRTVDGGPYTSGRALEAGLVDALVYPIDLPEHLGKDGERKSRILPAEHVLRSRKWRYRPPRAGSARIVVIPISGIIRTGRSLQLPSGPRFAGEETVVGQVEAARRDPRVRGVVVYSDSRGGMASASDRIWHAVARLAKEKPTAAYVESVAASGGYLAIAGAGRIFAAKGSLVGSIGVFSGRFSLGEFLGRLGIHREVLRRGENAGLLTSSRALEESERRVLQAEIDQIYEEFVDRVARGRSRLKEELGAYGEGRVYLAEEAPEALVDEIGDFRAALGWVVSQAKLPPGSFRVQVARDRGQRHAGLPAFLTEVARSPSSAYWLWAPGLPEDEGFLGCAGSWLGL